MSISYSDGLSPYTNKGVLGRPEVYDCPRELNRKVDELVTAIRSSKLFCVITGAGISTSAGIPDFRGPNGVWTMEEKNMKVKSINFSEAKPTFTHAALTTLAKTGKLKHLISQNVDGLHLKSGFPADRLVEVHGNFFCEICTRCNKKHFRDTPSECFGRIKPKVRAPCVGRCRGILKSTVLDWEDMLPRDYFDVSEKYIKACDLLLVLGSSLEIKPVSTLPALARKNCAKVVYINLQIIKNKYFNFGIHGKVDDVLKKVMESLNMPVITEVHPHTLPVLHSEFPPHEDRIIFKEYQNRKKRKSNYLPNFESKKCSKMEESDNNCSSNNSSEDPNGIEMDQSPTPEEKTITLSEKVESEEKTLLSEGIEPEEKTFVLSEKVESEENTLLSEGIESEEKTLLPEGVEYKDTTLFSEKVEPEEEKLLSEKVEPEEETVVLEKIESEEPPSSSTTDPIVCTSTVNSDSVTILNSIDSEVDDNLEHQLTPEKDIESIEEIPGLKLHEKSPEQSDDTQNLTADSEFDQHPPSNTVEEDG